MALSFHFTDHTSPSRTTDDCGEPDGLRLQTRLRYALKKILGAEVHIGV